VEARTGFPGGGNIATVLHGFMRGLGLRKPFDLATVVVLSLTGLDVSLWLVSKGWLAVLA
jgi:hypothetical protein